MTFWLYRLRASILLAVCLLVVVSCFAHAGVSTPFQILTNARNPIVWQEFHPWLMMTEDMTNGRTCYYYDPFVHSKLSLKQPQVGTWVPLGSAIKWVMYVDYYQGVDRLMAHDVDFQIYHIAWTNANKQVGCGMTGTTCIYGQFRPNPVGDHYPVDLRRFDVERGGSFPFCTSDSEKSQFANDGNLIVYRSYSGPGTARIYGIYFSGGPEFEIAARDAIAPSVCGSLVAWAEVNGPGFNIMAKDISTGDMRTIAYTTANPPRPQAGRGSVYWEDNRNLATTGTDVYGYDWLTHQEFSVTRATGNQVGLRVCDDLVTYVTGNSPYQVLWGATYQPPVQIADLRPTIVGSNSVQLSWTSAGYSQNLPVSYDLRVRTDGPITDANWASSAPVTGIPTPKSPGQPEAFAVVGLITGHYHLAIKARLANGEYTLLSNPVCAYVSEPGAAFTANLGSYVSFSGMVSALRSDGVLFCQKQPGPGAVRVSPRFGQTALVGQQVSVTGTLAQDPELAGPVLEQATVTPMGMAGTISRIAMSNAAIGGRDARFGGIGNGPSNLWRLVRTWGRVSGLTSGTGCSFYIKDGSNAPDCLEGVYVTSPFSAPAGLADGRYVVVEGISRVSKTNGRQIEVVSDGGVSIAQ